MKILVKMTTTNQCLTLQHWQAYSLYNLPHPSSKKPDEASINTPVQAIAPLMNLSAARLQKNPLQ
ncbi:MAG: hypothetical protein KME45_19090 [Stenomitos rutilans HA7619-LM2]|jgi:hypothetical protein|nr:hypothetical protein [Stenomitos rutilans HA7619-LM2]